MMISIDGINFSQESQIQKAFTHSSYSKDNYERLEFLGDSLLDFIVGEYYFKNYNMSEQELTRNRAFKVSEDNLSQVFDKLELTQYVLLGKSLKKDLKKSIKADMIESIIACIYLEFGLEKAKEFIVKNLKLNEIMTSKDAKSLFQEFAQANKKSFEYINYKTEGEAHNLKFYIKLIYDGQEISSAVANKKIDAEKKCAEIALKKLI